MGVRFISIMDADLTVTDYKGTTGGLDLVYTGTLR